MEREDGEGLREARELFLSGDAEGAFARYLDLANEGVAYAQAVVGWSYWKGEAIERDLEKARFWFQRAAERGEPQAQWYLARALIHSGNVAAALPWLERAANADFGPACFRLVRFYDQGKLLIRDRARAFGLAKQGMAAGHLRCQAKYARGLIRGREGLAGIIRGLRLMAKMFAEAKKLVDDDAEDFRLAW